MSDAAVRLHTIQTAIAEAARAARRKHEDVTLVAVSKTRSVDEIEALMRG